MRICMLADIHANLPALEAVLKKAGDVDLCLHAGDLVGYNPFPDEVVEMVGKLDSKFVSVRGNHDEAVVTGNMEGMNPAAAEAARWTREKMSDDAKKWLAELPLMREFSLDGKKGRMAHGSPLNPLWEYVEPDATKEYLELLLEARDMLVLGHTHVPMIRKVKGGWVVNPGSVGQPRDWEPKASFIILEIGDEKEPQFELVRVKYDVEKVAKAIRKEGLPGELANRLFDGR